MRMLIAATLIVGTTGCATKFAPLNQPSSASSVVDFTKELKTATSNTGDNTIGSALGSISSGLDAINTKIAKAKNQQKAPPGKFDQIEKDEVDFRLIKTWWCPRHPDAGSVKAIEARYIQICKIKGGQSQGPGCVANNGQDVLFYANVERMWIDRRRGESGCADNPNESVAVTVIEPTNSAQGQGYLNAVRSTGYVLPSPPQ